MKIAVFGLGYVGAVTGSCLASIGHSVTLIELDPQKVESFSLGVAPISEPGLETLIQSGLKNQNLNATTDTELGLENVECILISVGTPSSRDSGAPDLTSIISVANSIANHLKSSKVKTAIALCSTVPPNTTEKIFRKVLEENGISERKYSLAFIPEFLREGSAISDFMQPSRVVIGVREEIDSSIYLKLRPELKEITHIVPTEIAEMLKTVENTWHALKISFANEVSRICEPYQIDSNEVMNMLILDSKQNISPAYMRPGFSFGGSCLPKDLRSLQYLASSKGVSIPLIENILKSNTVHIEQSVNLIRNLGRNKIAILGLAFKANTDDLRESPTLELIKELIKEDNLIRVHDFNVVPARLIGVNKEIWNSIPILKEIFSTDLETVIANAEVLVIAQYEKRYREVLQCLPKTAIVINLVNV